jgi:uncharacterized protein
LKYLKQFSIPIVGLDPGSYQYEFDIDNMFFESFGGNEIQKCAIKVDLTLHKQEDMIILLFSFYGTVELICDRCLDPFDLPVAGKESIELKFGKPEGKQKADEEFIAREQQEMDIRQYIYDFISLNIPFRKVHPEDMNGQSNCDPEVIKKIEELKETKTIDPRWDQLKDIQIN